MAQQTSPSSSASTSPSSEIILKQNTKYWFDLTNIASPATNFISWTVSWYEHTDGP